MQKRLYLVFPVPQSPPPAAQEPPVSDTADLLGLNTGPETPSTSSAPSSASHQGVQGGMKAASSNSDLLNDLFASPAGETASVQEDLFFTEPTSGATADSKRMGWSVIYITAAVFLSENLSCSLRLYCSHGRPLWSVPGGKWCRFRCGSISAGLWTRSFCRLIRFW